MLVWASMADKDVAGILRGARRLAGRLGGHGRLHRARRPSRAPRRATSPRPGARRVPGARVLVEPDPGAALDLALATGDGPVVVAGSLYLVGAARARLVDDPLLRDPVAA